MRSRLQPALVMLACLGLLLALASLPGHAQAAPPPGVEAAAGPAAKSLFLIGDGSLSVISTPPVGEAPTENTLPELFRSDRIHVVELAETQRTIRTYITAGDWAAALQLMKPGDVVLIQFAPAANDNVQRALPGTGDQSEELDDRARNRREFIHTYGWYLRQYAVDTLAKGATPILCTPPASGAPGGAPAETAQWVRDIAIQQRVAYLPPPPIGATPSKAAVAIIAGLRALPTDPLAGYFTERADRIPPAPAATTP